MPASHVLILLAPFAISLGWLILFAMLPRTTSPRPVTAPGPLSDADREDLGHRENLEDGEDFDDLDDDGAIAQPPGNRWRCWISLAYVVYHFPVVVPACWVSKNDTCPRWLLLTLTPVLYAGILYLLLVR